jgi:hypothetical protein
MQIQGGMQTVTAIVARPASDPNALGMWRPGHGHLGHGLTGPLHQARVWVGAERLVFKGACFVHPVQGPFGEWGDPLHGFGW